MLKMKTKWHYTDVGKKDEGATTINSQLQNVTKEETAIELMQ
jgi:hypothetical protein